MLQEICYYNSVSGQVRENNLFQVSHHYNINVGFFLILLSIKYHYFSFVLVNCQVPIVTVFYAV